MRASSKVAKFIEESPLESAFLRTLRSLRAVNVQYEWRPSSPKVFGRERDVPIFQGRTLEIGSMSG